MSNEVNEIRDKFLKKGIVFIYGEIDSESCSAFFEHMLLLEARDVKKIEVRISSPGGRCKEALSMYDLIRTYPGEVTGVVYGGARSMAAVVLQACKYRKMLEHAEFLAHDVRRQPVTYSEMTRPKDQRRVRKSTKKMQMARIKIFTESSKMSEEQVIKMMRKNKPMSRKKASRLGLIDLVEDEK